MLSTTGISVKLEIPRSLEARDFKAQRRYEVHHGVTIRDSALIAAARYADRWSRLFLFLLKEL
jgi:hypothetical protein